MIHPLPRRFHFVVPLVAAAAAIASTWPVALHWRDHVVDGARLINPKDPGNWWAANIGADVLTTVWVVNWVLHALVTQPLHLFEANIFYPAPHALARSEHIVATALLGAPGRLLAGPVAAHQSALLLCIALNVWATAYLVTRWTGSLLGGLVAGLLFAVSPFHQGGLFHLQRLGTFYYPLILLGLERFGATGGGAWVALAAVAFVMQLLSGQYLAYFALGVWGIGGTLALAARWSTARPLRRVGRDAAWLGGATAAAALAVLPFALPYALLEAGGELPDNTAHLVLSSMPALRCYLFGSYLIPTCRFRPRRGSSRSSGRLRSRSAAAPSAHGSRWCWVSASSAPCFRSVPNPPGSASTASASRSSRASARRASPTVPPCSSTSRSRSSRAAVPPG